MKKYFQIIIVLGTFFLLVLIKNFRGGDEKSTAVVPVNPVSPTAAAEQGTPIPTDASQQPKTTPNLTVTQQPTITAIPTPPPARGRYRDGTFTGSVEDANYGNIQVQAMISGGTITDVIFLQYPNDNRTSININSQAMPILKEEAIQAQSEQVNMISGASYSSPAFQRSLASALSQAK